MGPMLHLFAAALVLLGGAAPARAHEIVISAAISVKDAVAELGRGLAAACTGLIVRHNFGPSGELQKQIEAGAPVDLFISAAQLRRPAVADRGPVMVHARSLSA